MSIMAMCLPEHLNRFVLSSNTVLFCIFGSIGFKNEKTYVTNVSVRMCDILYFLFLNVVPTCIGEM
jgi:hypothetical protein